MAALAIELAQAEKAKGAREREAERQRIAELDAIDRELLTLEKLIGQAAAERLRQEGLHQHHRQWRRRRHAPQRYKEAQYPVPR